MSLNVNTCAGRLVKGANLNRILPTSTMDTGEDPPDIGTITRGAPSEPRFIAALRRWRQQAPSDKALAERLPFDTTAEWIRWVLNPERDTSVADDRKEAIIEHENALLDDHTAAEEVAIFCLQALERFGTELDEMSEEIESLKERLHDKIDHLSTNSKS